MLLSVSIASCTILIVSDDSRFTWPEQDTLGCTAMRHDILVTNMRVFRTPVLQKFRFSYTQTFSVDCATDSQTTVPLWFNFDFILFSISYCFPMAWVKPSFILCLSS